MLFVSMLIKDNFFFHSITHYCCISQSIHMKTQQEMTKKPQKMPNQRCLVPDPGKGVCADPVNGDAILREGGPDPQGGNKERQLSPDKGRVKT
jgi:hypothetical protein